MPGIGGGSISRHGIGRLKAFSLKTFPAPHLFFARTGGESRPPFDSFNTAWRTKDPDSHLNRNILCETLGIDPEKIVILSPSHGHGTVFDPEGGKGGEPAVILDTDAVFTSRPDQYLMAGSADCIILLVTEPEISFVGLIHLGWRNIVSDFLGGITGLITSRYKVDANRLLWGMGPCIGPCCYRFENPVQKNDPFWQPFLKTSADGLTAIDLISAVKERLAGSGVQREAVHETGLCTGCLPDLFFSAYRDGYVSGRFPTIVSSNKTKRGIWT